MFQDLWRVIGETRAYAHLPINGKVKLEIRVNVIQNLGSVPCRRDMRLPYRDGWTESYHRPGSKPPEIQVLFRRHSP